MFFVVFEDGTKATEADFGDWDHVPYDKRITQAGLLMPPPLPPIILPRSERYYIARIGAAPLGGIDRWLGYILIGIKNGICQRITAKYDGIVPDAPDPVKLNIRESAWRDGSL